MLLVPRMDWMWEMPKQAGGGKDPNRWSFEGRDSDRWSFEGRDSDRWSLQDETHAETYVNQVVSVGLASLSSPSVTLSTDGPAYNGSGAAGWVVYVCARLIGPGSYKSKG